MALVRVSSNVDSPIDESGIPADILAVIFHDHVDEVVDRG